MIIESLVELYKRDLTALKKEIELYSDESIIWKSAGQINNSAGNLCTHLIGNLNTFIGNGLCNIGYVRQRDLEFSVKNIDRELLYEQIQATKEMLVNGISNLQAEDLLKPYPIIIWKKERSMVYTIMKIHSHLNYHLGQINYHRRLLDKETNV